VGATYEIHPLIMPNKCWKRDLCLERALFAPADMVFD